MRISFLIEILYDYICKSILCQAAKENAGENVYPKDCSVLFFHAMVGPGK